MNRRAALALLPGCACAVSRSRGAVSVLREAHHVRFSVDGRHVLDFVGRGRLPRAEIGPEFLRGGYLHPVRTPSGCVLTDDYPPNHIHHHGIWTAWTRTAYEGRAPDFWNMGQKKGKTDLVSVLRVDADGLLARMVATDLTVSPPRDVLHDDWHLIVRATPRDAPYFIFDLTTEQVVLGDAPLQLLRHHYGGLGVRGHRSWDGHAGATFLTSEGKTRGNGDGVPARWVDIGGVVDGATVGLAVLIAADNPRFPTPVRLHPNEPFMCITPVGQEAMTLRRGDRYRARYRFVAHDGPADLVLLDRLWDEWARTP